MPTMMNVEPSPSDSPQHSEDDERDITQQSNTTATHTILQQDVHINTDSTSTNDPRRRSARRRFPTVDWTNLDSPAALSYRQFAASSHKTQNRTPLKKKKNIVTHCRFPSPVRVRHRSIPINHDSPIYRLKVVNK